MYTRCPKCGHAPLPADQSLPAACGSCGVILAKVGQAVSRPPAAVHRAFHAANEPWSEPGPDTGSPALIHRLLDVPERIDPMRFWLRTAMLAGFGLWGFVLISQDVRTGELGGSFIHRPLLVFHEAGHVIFMILGEWMSVLGGTLGQLLMPLLLAFALLWKNRDTFGAAIGLWLFGVSLLDVAPYIFDAVDPQLTLLNGQSGEAGGHDWIYLLSSMGWLARSQAMGMGVHRIGALVVIAALLWAAWILRLQYARLDGDVIREK
ncbi:MAG: hypothetical protein EOO28_23190 [Comamonadaceae bacterium]|nr:MAG: hypothetical protein EOO28_23190 [Comamonadaceae bacterium]